MRKAIWSIPLLVASVSVSVTAQTTVSGALVWTPEYKRLSCNGPVAINVTWADYTPPDFMVGVDPDAKLTNEIQVAAGSLVPYSFGMPLRRVFDDIPSQIREKSSCNISLQAGAAGKRIALHLRVADGRRVTITLNGMPFADLVASGSGAVIYDGKILENAGPLHVLKVLANGYKRGMTEPAQDIVHSPQGQYQITIAGFRRHLIPTSELSFASQVSKSDGQCCEGSSMLTFKVAVSSDGKLEDAVQLNVPADRSTQLTQIVRSIRLRPFIAEGSAVPASGVLSLLLSSSGRLYYLY
jgi:hypothetical protein